MVPYSQHLLCLCWAPATFWPAERSTGCSDSRTVTLARAEQLCRVRLQLQDRAGQPTTTAALQYLLQMAALLCNVVVSSHTANMTFSPCSARTRCSFVERGSDAL